MAPVMAFARSPSRLPRPFRHGVALLLAGAAVLPASAGADETRASANITAGAGYANNPFVGQGGGGSVFAQVGVSPEVRIVNETRTIAIGADVFHQEYFNDFPANTTYQARADYSQRLNETTSVHARGSYQSALLGAFGFGGFGSVNPIVQPPVVDPVTGVGAGAVLVNPGVGVGFPVVPGTEIGAFGAGRRQRTFNLAGDFSSTISSRDSVTGSIFYVNSSFGGGRDLQNFGNLGDYNGYGSSLGINRRLSEFTSVGLLGSVSSYNYQQAQSDTRVYSIQATASTRLNEFWSLDGALGASFLQQQLGGNSATLSGNANLCRRGERSSTCLQASRAVLPTGFAGTQTQTSVGLNWQMQVGEGQNVSLGASYVSLDSPRGSLPVGSDNGTIPGLPGAFDNQIGQVNAGYSRAIGRRLQLSPSVYYRSVFGGTLSRADDYGGQISLSYRLGDLR